MSKTVRLFTLSALLMAGALRASAQTAPTTESVTVMGSREAYHTFSRTFATPTHMSGKMARWERPLCPVVLGQNAHYTAFITQHIKYVGLAAGAPVATEPSCRPNIEIVFTTTPQALLDTVRKDHQAYLGYFTSLAQADALAKVTKPIQAWYATETTDVKGRTYLDAGHQLINGDNIPNMSGTPFPDSEIVAGGRGRMLDLPPFRAVLGSRLNDGIHTGFAHVLIVVDSTKLAGQEVLPLADYIAMLALTQINSLDACQELPSIVNRMAADCPRIPDSLTQFDLAYLQGLYHLSTGRTAVLQRSEIGALMTDRLENPR
jgi:hypothetical protein